jgi:predicted MFS family arabinose efflux permease
MINKTVTTYRDAYTGLSRSTWLLSLVMLINRSGTMVVPFMSLYLTSPAMGYSIGQAGFVFGLFGAGAFTGAWLGGKLTDKIGFYPVQVITLIGGGLLFVVLGQMKSYPFICLFTFILSFVNEAFRPANSTAIAFYSKEENRTRSYSLNRLSINLGWAIGSAIGGIIARYNYELLFWVDGLTNIGAAVLMLIFVKPVNYKPARQKKDAGIPKQSAFHDTTYMWFILFTSLFACCFFQLFTNLSVYYKLKLNFSTAFIGFLMATNGLIIVLVEMVIVYKLEGRRKNTFYIVTGILLMAIAYFMLNVFLIGHLLAFVMIIVVTFGEILSMPFMNSYWIGRSKIHNRGQYAALYTMAWSAAQTLGPLTGAQIAEHYGFNWLWWIVAGLSLVTAFAFMRLHIRSGNNKQDDDRSETLTGTAELIAISNEPVL